MLVVFGSINADLVYQVARIPRPGETVSCAGWSFAAGGKGANQAGAAALAGGQVAFIGRTGDDANGWTLRRSLEDVGVDCSHLLLSPRPTGTAVIAVEHSGENAIIVAGGANLDVVPEQVPALGPDDTLLCQNEVPLASTFAVLRRAHAAGARTILNMAPAGDIPADVLKALDVLVVNEIEAETVVGRSEEPVRLARTLAMAHNMTCVVTLGMRGSIAIGPNGGWQVSSLPVRVVDTTGAGDAYVGVLAANLAQGRDWPSALARASIAAGLSCEKLGAREGHPTAAQIDAVLASFPPVQTLAD